MTAAVTQATATARQVCDRMLRRSMWASNLTILLTFGVVGGWLAIARLDSAVVAPGVLQNVTTTRTVQHLEGGIVREIFVKNGDEVREGDLLLRLDSTQNRASADLLRTQLLGNRARQERLEAEIAMAPTLTFSQAVTDQMAADPVVARIAEDERRRFELQRNELIQSRDLLQNNIAQAETEIRANEVRQGVARRQADLIRPDLEDQKALRAKGLTNQARVTELEQESLEIEETIAQSEIEISRIRQAIAAFRLQMAQAEQEYRGRAIETLEEVTREIRALERDLIILDDSLRRVEIRAPVDGTVQESILGTIGAVIGGGTTILKIAPREDEYIIAARVSPNEVDGIVPGAAAYITFPAFQSLGLSPSDGQLLTLSRDRVTDPATRTEYYEARVRLDETTLPEAQRLRLVAGLSATVILPTGERTALNYLVGPMLQRMQSAMREE